MQKQPCTEIWVYLEHSTLDSPLWPRLYYFLTIAGWLILKTTMAHQHASLYEKKIKKYTYESTVSCDYNRSIALAILKTHLNGILEA